MKELGRFAGYTAATLVMIFVLIGIAKSDVSPGMLAFSAIFIVVVLPVIASIFIAKSERSKIKKDEEQQQ